MTKVLLSGTGGRVMWSYTVAAEVDRFEVQQGKQGLTLTALLKSSDVFKLRQSPLTFEVPVAGGRWTWPITSLTVTDKRVTAALRSQRRGKGECRDS